MASTTNHGHRSWLPYTVLFVGLTFVYHSNLRYISGGDTLPAALIPFSVWLDGTVSLDRFHDEVVRTQPQQAYSMFESGGHWRSAYPITGPLAMTPVYLPLAILPQVRSAPPGTLIAISRVAEKFPAALLAALSGCVMFAVFRRLVDHRAAWMLVAVYALGSSIWSTASQAMWQHTPGTLALAGSLWYFLRWREEPDQPRWVWALSACIALAIAFRLSNTMLLPAVAVAFWVERAPFMDWLRMSLWPTLAIGILTTYNMAVSGRLGGYYYDSPVTGWPHLLPNLAGALFSPGRGLLVYMPVLALVLLSRRESPDNAAARPSMKGLRAFCWSFVALQTLVVGLWGGWWGGFSWGPRLLIEVVPFALVLLAMSWSRPQFPAWRAAFVGLALWGVFVQALGAYCFPHGLWNEKPVSVDLAPYRLWDWHDNPIGRTFAAGPVTEPYKLVWTALTEGPGAAANRLKEYRLK